MAWDFCGFKLYLKIAPAIASAWSKSYDSNSLGYQDMAFTEQQLPTSKRMDLHVLAVTLKWLGVEASANLFTINHLQVFRSKANDLCWVGVGFKGVATSGTGHMSNFLIRLSNIGVSCAIKKVKTFSKYCFGNH